MTIEWCRMLILPVLIACCATQAGAQDIAAGKSIAQANCARCHAIGLDDESVLDPAPAFRTLTERYPVEALAEALAEGIYVGHEEMPEFVFEPKEIGDLLGYIDWLGREAGNTQ